MFARSESHFRPDNPPGEHRTNESTGQTGDAELFGLLSRIGEISFNNGLYRAMDQGITRLAGQFIDTAFSARPSRAPAVRLRLARAGICSRFGYQNH